jgi:hypothetical protein
LLSVVWRPLSLSALRLLPGHRPAQELKCFSLAKFWGSVTPSFIPPRWQRELRDLTRRRREVIETATSEKNRIEKTLEDANVKLSSVLSDIFGVSGQLMLEALLKGKADPTQIAQFAKRAAKKKIPQIIAALEEHQMQASSPETVSGHTPIDHAKISVPTEARSR